MQDRAQSFTAGDTQRGHLLVGLMVLVTVLMILLTVSGQSWTFLMRRDNEAEMIFRGEQYANAIGFYQKETGQYPLDLKVLMQRGPHRHRYIRKLWKDPLAKDGKWGVLYMSPTGKGFINPYATRRDQEQFLAGTFGEQDSGGGFGGNSGSFGRKTGGRRSAFGRSGEQEQEEKAGYSEPLPDNFNLRGGDAAGMPIVGVVHRKKESGLKIYKNQANLNDWAFTLLAEGQDLRMGGSVAPPTGTPRNLGVGDGHNPIFFNPADRPGAPKGPGGRTSPIQDLLRKRRQEDAERKQKEKEQQEQERGDEQPPDEGEPDEDETDEDETDEEYPPEEEDPEEQDPNAPADPDAPPDPNAPQDPNAPEDPNAEPDRALP